MTRTSWTARTAPWICEPRCRRRPEVPPRRGLLVAILGVLLAALWPGPAWAGTPRAAIEGGGALQRLGPPEGTGRKPWGTVVSVDLPNLLVVAMPDDGSREVRLYGIESPQLPRATGETRPPIPGQPYGAEAFRYIRDLLTGKLVQLETFGKDRHGRSLAVVWLGDVNVNLTLVREGLAWVSPGVSDARVRSELEVAEQWAQKAKYGLWSLPDPEPPWRYRKRLGVPPE